MKKLYLLLGMLAGGAWAQAQTCTTTISTFPHLQDFETGTTGSPGTFPTGWVMTPGPGTGTPYRWQMNAGATGSSLTGPNVDHTSGTSTGKYAYTEASFGTTGDVTLLTSPCINLANMTTPGMEFWYHMAGPGMGSLDVQISTNNGATWTTLQTYTGPQQASENDPWLKKTISFAGYTGTALIRFKGNLGPTGSSTGASYEGDIAIDDVKFFNIPPIDAEVTALTLPGSACGLSATETICISIKNNGSGPLTNIPVNYTINNGTPVAETANITIAPGATGNYCFTTKANLSAFGTYTIVGRALVTNDGDATNNSKTGTVTSVQSVSTFPYNENFEASNGGWIAGGTSSSWAWGTPAGTTINSAASGTKAWVTNLTGNYNTSENSWIVGPCFNFSNLNNPIIQFKIWWAAESSYDGAVLQSSIDGGTTWQVIGAMGDPDNWYNDNTIAGAPGGQPGTTAIGWSGNGTGTPAGSNGWVLAKHALTGLGNKPSVRLRLAFGADNIIDYEGIGFDDISIYETPSADVGVMSVNTPVNTSCGASTTETVSITIKNFGSAPQSNIPVTYRLNNGTFIANESVPGPLNPGATTTYNFTTKANLSAGGNFTVEAKTALAADNITVNDAATKTVTITNPITTFPHIQDFEQATTGSPGVLPAGWVMTAGPGSFPYRWEVLSGPTSSSLTGPNVDHTLGTAAGKYVYTEASNGANGDSTSLMSPCVNLNGLTTPGFDFWYHMAGPAMGTLKVQVSNNNGATWATLLTLTGPQQASEADPWLKKTVSLAGYTGTVNIRFRGTKSSTGNTFEGDIAIDDVKFYNIPANDLEVTSVTLPASACGLTATETICITIKNNGGSPVSNFPVRYTVNNLPPVQETANITIAPGATGQYCFTTKANLSAFGQYTVTGTSALANDGDPSNNSKTNTVTNVQSVSSFPYNENFENGNGGWTAGGTASSWALGTPAKTTINSAASGTKAWVTNLTGSYNTSENSFVMGPCFNFTGIPDPDFEMMAWWAAETSYDGAVLQSSIDGGATWQVVGAMGDPNNWYNDNTIAGGPGGQPGTTAVGWTGNGSSTPSGSNGWVKVKHKLNGLGNKANVRLRIAFGSDNIIEYDGFAFDDIMIGDNSNNLAVQSFVPFTKLCGFNNSEPVKVMLENLGSTPVSNFNVSYTLNNGQPVTEAFNGSLAPATPTMFTFSQGANMQAPGPYNFVVTVTKTGDPQVSNNTVNYSITNASFTGMPPAINFETPASNLSAVRVVTNSKSAITENAAANNGPTGTKGMVMEGVTNPNWSMPIGVTDPWTNNSENFSAVYICFNPSGGAATDPLWLSFDLKQLFKTANANTNFRVTVNGTQVGQTYHPPFSGSPIAWQRINVDLSAYKNLTGVQVGLESSVAEPYANGAGTANLVDNISITRFLGVKDQPLENQLTVFPNPSTGQFQVTLPKGKNFAIEVTDLTGKVISKQTAAGGENQVNLKDAAKGIYLLKVSSAEGMAVRKLVVE